MCNVCSQGLSSPLWPDSSSLFPIDTEHFNHACKYYSNPGIQMLSCCILSNELVRNDIIKVFNQSILGWKTDCIEISFRTSSFTLIKEIIGSVFVDVISQDLYINVIYQWGRFGLFSMWYSVTEFRFINVELGPFRFVFNVICVNVISNHINVMFVFNIILIYKWGPFVLFSKYYLLSLFLTIKMWCLYSTFRLVFGFGFIFNVIFVSVIAYHTNVIFVWYRWDPLGFIFKVTFVDVIPDHINVTFVRYK